MNKYFFDQILRSAFAIIAGVLLFLALWGVRLFGVYGEPVTEATVTFFGCSFHPQLPLQVAISALLILVDIYLIYHLSSEYTLFDTRTHFAPSQFLAIVGGAAFFMPLQNSNIALPLALTAIFILLSTYQQRQATNEYVTAFILLGIVTILSPKWMLLLPFIFLGCGVCQSLAPRNFAAGLIGFIAPYWISAGVLYLCGHIADFVLPFQELIRFSAIDYATLTVEQVTAGAVVLFMAVPALFLYPNTSFTLKEKARVAYLFLIILFASALLLVLLQPTLFTELIPLLAVLACIFVTRMLLASNERFGSTYLLLLILIYLLYITVPLWKDSLIF